MESELHNTASDRGREFTGPLGDPDRFDALRAELADDFVREDRRRFVSTGTVDRDGYMQSLRSWHEIADGLPSFNLERVVATRGDHAAVNLITVTYDDGSRTDFLVLAQLDEAGEKWKRFVFFDADDIDAALEALALLPREGLPSEGPPRSTPRR